MESAGLRNRGDKKITHVQKSDTPKILNVTKNIDLKFLDIKEFNDFGTHSLAINVEPYDSENKIFITITNRFLIKEIKDYSLCVIGRLVNDKVISITNEEQEMWEFVGLKVGDVPKNSGFLGF